MRTHTRPGRIAAGKPETTNVVARPATPAFCGRDCGAPRRVARDRLSLDRRKGPAGSPSRKILEVQARRRRRLGARWARLESVAAASESGSRVDVPAVSNRQQRTGRNHRVGVSNEERLGFRSGDRGTHSSRTLMLVELRRLLGTAPAGAARQEYRELVLEENALGKRTSSIRSRAIATPATAACAVALGYRRRAWLYGGRARQAPALHVVESPDRLPGDEFVTLVQKAARHGWIDYRAAGDVVDIRPMRLFMPHELELCNGESY